jgi:hypothetical protein
VLAALWGLCVAGRARGGPDARRVGNPNGYLPFVLERLGRATRSARPADSHKLALHDRPEITRCVNRLQHGVPNAPRRTGKQESVSDLIDQAYEFCPESAHGIEPRKNREIPASLGG